MKNHLFLLFLLFLSCGQVDQEKPENLIGEEKMADLIFELALFDASKAFVIKGETDRIGLDGESFYQYHNIDSTQFAVSNAYYAKQPKAYLRITSAAKKKLEDFEKRVEEIQNEKIAIDSIGKKLSPKIIMDE
jgi:hypothetical protein